MAARGGIAARWAGLTVGDRVGVAVLSAVAVAVRLVLIAAYSPVLTSDSYSYLDLAHRLGALHLEGAPGTRTPGYPLVLLTLGYSPVATWCVQALLGVLATMLVYALVRRLGGGPRLALAAGLLYALDFEALAVEHMILTETLTTFLLLVAAHLALTIVAVERPPRAAPIGLGLVLAYLCLVRPDMLTVAAYLVLALWVALGLGATRHGATGHGPTRRWLLAPPRALLWVALPPLAALAAWAGVNRATIGVTTISTVIGYNMIDHVAPYVQARPGPDYPITSAYVMGRATSHATYNVSSHAQDAMERASHLNGAHLSGRLLSIALGVIERHPLQYLGSSLKQWPRFWLSPNYAYAFATGGAASLVRVIWKVERAVLVLVNLGFVLLLVSDLAQRARRRRPLLPSASLMLAGVPIVGLVPATFFAYGDTGRYGSVYYPLALSVAVAGAELLRRALSGRYDQRTAGTVRAGTTPIR